MFLQTGALVSVKHDVWQRSPAQKLHQPLTARRNKKHCVFGSYFSVTQHFWLLFQFKWAELDWKYLRLFFMAREHLNMQMGWSWVQCKTWPFLFGLSFQTLELPARWRNCIFPTNHVLGFPTNVLPPFPKVDMQLRKIMPLHHFTFLCLIFLPFACG